MSASDHSCGRRSVAPLRRCRPIAKKRKSPNSYERRADGDSVLNKQQMRKRVPRRAGHCLNKHESILRKNGSRGSNMKRIPFWLVVCTTVALAAFAGRAISAQDKYTLQVPDGLSFAEFRGYEDWQVFSISQATIPSIGELIEVILANPVMIEAYRAGID